MKRFSILLTLFVGATSGYIVAAGNSKLEADAIAAADTSSERSTQSDIQTAVLQLSADVCAVTAETDDEDRLAQAPVGRAIPRGKNRA